jgi:hypothetical protein
MAESGILLLLGYISCDSGGASQKSNVMARSGPDRGPRGMKESSQDLRGISNAMNDSADCRDPSQLGDIMDLLGSLSRSMESTELRRLPGWGGYDRKWLPPSTCQMN